MSMLFICYSHQDEAWKNRITKHLDILGDLGISAWDDRQITAGDNWHSAIEHAIQECQIALLLISSDFLASRFIQDTEIPALLKRREKDGLRVIPLIIRPCAWARLSWLQPIQARPKDGNALSGLSMHKAEQTLADLASEITAEIIKQHAEAIRTVRPFRCNVAYISSSTIDLPEHREKIRTASLHQGLIPEGMETWPAVDADAVTLCLDKVDRADVFIGIYGHRYGWVPPGQTKSITELEYDRAVERGIPRLVFVMAEDHLVLPKDVEKGSGGEKMDQFKARIATERVHKTFSNADQLRAEVVLALKAWIPSAETPATHATSDHPAPDIDLSHLPAAAPHFLGRSEELALLDAAWASAGRTTVLEMIAHGGTGKTSLMNRWLAELQADGWRGATRVFGWSFYSQGAGEDRQASDDGFFAAALTFFQVHIAPSTAAWDKGVRLAQALGRQRALLILDGLEPLQYPPTDTALAGELKAPGLQALLQTLARNGGDSLVLVTSREPLADIAGWRQHAD
ncbi:MAG: hypothetical protein RIR00_1848, partial [Pseudomonadota bacterium]